MKRGMWMGLVAVAVTTGFMAASMTRAEDVAASTTPGEVQKSNSGWTAKTTGKTWKKSPYAGKPVAKPVIKYVCPMGDYTGDKPGKCPKCGMELKRTVVTPEKKAVPATK